ncbi:MAG: glucoamylase family protein, partial [Candidatus Desantisbacteria bacterium]
DWAEPESGLILDRSAFPDLISISATGFGLTALCIGAESGWISKTDAYDKTLKIIQTCNNIIEKQSQDPANYGKWGFFYHFLDPGTGGAKFIPPKRKGDTELSTIDTALLVCGVLTAGEYFGGEVKIGADKLYKSIQWDKFLYTEGKANDKNWPRYGTYSNQFFSAWKPGNEYTTSPYVDEEGRFSNRFFDRPDEPFTWDYYTDEEILLCIMGIASPTHPVGTNTFYAWKREQGTYGNYSLIQSHPGSLFTYFFTHCWLKLKNLGSDNHPVTPINWWENSVNAAGANWKYCQDKNYEGWGLTACEGPDGGYHAYGALPCGDTSGPKDDATIAPYGAGSSIAFLPVESISTLKHYFQNTDLWRYLFGFGDAYNPSNATVTAYYNGSWYNHSYFGIDQGPMLIMIENYRSELVWKYFMQNGDVQRALPTIFPATKPYLIITKKARNISQRGVGNEYFDPEGTLE